MAEPTLLSVRFKESSEKRLVIVVSKKVESTAVGRNRIRRRIKEIFRKHNNASVQAGTTTVYTKRPIAHASFADIADAFRVVLS